MLQSRLCILCCAVSLSILLSFYTWPHSYRLLREDIFSKDVTWHAVCRNWCCILPFYPKISWEMYISLSRDSIKQRSLACFHTFSFMIILSIQYFIHYLCLKAWKRHSSASHNTIAVWFISHFFISILFFDKLVVGYPKPVVYKCNCCCITFIKSHYYIFC